ncbi:exopolysaccharide biosynthesis polyprenyl glycosylphosphotransferase [Sphingomonas flavescens]|uniref:exopolysaccharide biosynthesis polyprenyl glycosylphosphotransferase n=1 Tax=Sphingomonas flavescens TaxID=3132797 RepID=UPI002804C9D7|nr:exopolysaccharide biosynthesis polyprenyl glycosylphosphotransferase [Sphingomonas limnosediminicola]
MRMVDKQSLVPAENQVPPTIANAPSRGRRRIRFTSNVVGTLYLLTDILCFVFSVPLALTAYSLVRSSNYAVSVHVTAFILMLGSFLLIRLSRQAYRRSLLDLRDSSDTTFDAVISSLIASALIWQGGLVEDYSRGIALLFLLTVVLALSVSRPLLHRLITRLAERGQIEQRIAFYGADPASVALTRQLLESLKFPHLRFVGIADDRARETKLEGLPMLGDLARLCDLARDGEVDQVLISGANFTTSRLEQIVEGLSEVAVDVSLIPAQAIELAPNYSVNLLGTVPVLTLWQRPFRDMSQVMKRAEDLVFSVVAIILLSPILALAALLIRFTSPGPILFVQPRVGFNNETIRVFKFRTMYTHMTDIGARQTTTKDDPRITPVGKWLRRLSIDELPQLFNVLQGSMSLVGPRPHGTEMMVGDRFYHDAVRGYAGRHRVKPGITGYAQVKGLRGEVRTIERAKRRVELDKHYVDNWSFWLDMWILLATVRAVLFDKDAY